MVLDRFARELGRIRNRHVFGADLTVLLLAAPLALVLRTESVSSLGEFGVSVFLSGACLTLVTLLVFNYFRLYQRMWRYASIDEMARIVIASAIAAIAQLLTLSMMQNVGLLETGFPRSIPVIQALIAFPLLTLPRFGARLGQRILERRERAPRANRVIIAGAGAAGMMIVEEMQSNPHLGLQPIAFVDDDPRKQQLRVRGLQVLGTTSDLPKLSAELSADRVVIAMPTASGKAIRQLSDLARTSGLNTLVIPGVYELLDGQVHVSQLRPVQVEDLLRRAPVRVDRESVDNVLRGKRVLVTGAGGSIGSELCRQIARSGASELILVGHGENSVFRIASEMSRNFAGIDCFPVIANIRDRDRIRRVFKRFRPHMVFHAAAHKHVPLMEENPEEAVTNNVLGTRNVLEVSQEFEVDRFVMISTDKAVNPANIMGSTKRVAEMLVYDAAKRSSGAYMTVRFGNVLGSRGSVLETFRAQIASGGPITVTHPDMRRYFMTIPEAVTLVLQTCAMGVGGELFVLDMGEPVRIVDLARDLIRLSGLREGDDIDIVFSGARSGEKLFEEIFQANEEYVRTDHRSVFVCASAGDFSEPAGGDGEGGPALAFSLHEHVDRLIAAAHLGDEEEIRLLLSHLVPTFGTEGVGFANA